MSTSRPKIIPDAHDRGADKIVRHALVDRLYHWITAASGIVLLVTGFFPIVGIKFPWLVVHWVAGLVLIAASLFHIVRALFWQRLRLVWIGKADFQEASTIVRRTLRVPHKAARKPGKYSFAQKLAHLFFALGVIATSVTGGLMLAGIATPWWRRDTSWLAEATWGWIYAVHDFAALALITLVMTHIYFSLRPEKWKFMRSMLVGWITRREYVEEHDPQRWQP